MPTVNLKQKKSVAANNLENEIIAYMKKNYPRTPCNTSELRDRLCFDDKRREIRTDDEFIFAVSELFDDEKLQDCTCGWVRLPKSATVTHNDD